MEAAKAFAKHLYNALLPHEADVVKFESVIAFSVQKWRGAIYFVLINIIYFVLKYLNISTYSGLGIISLLYFTAKFWAPILLKVLNPRELGDAKHHDLKEISSWFATIILVIVNLYNSAVNSVATKNFLGICTYMFVFFFLFYLFLSIPDYFLGFLILNGLSLVPFYLLNFDCEKCKIWKKKCSAKAE